MKLYLLLVVIIISVLLCFRVIANTKIKIYNDYRKELNVKIKGAGVGGCDILISPHQNNTNSCSCLWGTLNYEFRAYVSFTDGMEDEYVLCSDKKSLGNCYDGPYSCEITHDALCHCSG